MFKAISIWPYNPKTIDKMIQALTVYIVTTNIKRNEDDHKSDEQKHEEQ